MRYVDGFVWPVPTKNLKAYRAISQKAGKIFKAHGALQYVEAVGDDLDVKMGVSFSRTIKAKPDETIVFSFIVYKSRAARDRTNAKVMKDPRLLKMMNEQACPFEVKRMVSGGFRMMVDA